MPKSRSAIRPLGPIQDPEEHARGVRDDRALGQWAGDPLRAANLLRRRLLVVRHVIIFGYGHGLQRAIIDESQHRTPERLIMAQH